VLAGTVLLWDLGMLPRWTGAAPPEPVGTTELTSGPWDTDEHAVDVANAAATDPSLNPAPGAVEPPAIAEQEAPARASSPTEEPAAAPASTEEPAPAPTEEPAPAPPGY
jgi:hypothetical protein